MESSQGPNDGRRASAGTVAHLPLTAQLARPPPPPGRLASPACRTPDRSASLLQSAVAMQLPLQTGLSASRTSSRTCYCHCGFLLSGSRGLTRPRNLLLVFRSIRRESGAVGSLADTNIAGLAGAVSTRLELGYEGLWSTGLSWFSQQSQLCLSRRCLSTGHQCGGCGEMSAVRGERGGAGVGSEDNIQ